MKIIGLIQENKYITISEISDELGITTRAIEK
ncbi:MAG: winged helix-turn-helix transcriptional regulator [Candidatus Marinimicrobia bacterium]|nr:winged helix-turn-helix transcriptional regulator [Candidatus Neomarinimicrobiota bacterium]MBT4144246.1 winged helix-turn-helix transcriptional regulator [Candidatus Neomarinimicrobiota bacterium]